MSLYSLIIFSLPHIDSDSFPELETRHALQFVEGFAAATTTMRDYGHPFLAYCWKTMLTIWLNKKKDPDFDVSDMLEDFKTNIQSHKDIEQFDHYLTWVYFMAAAASPDAALHKFFKDRLFKHTITFGWKNVGMMHKFLEELVDHGSEWPSRLQSHKQYICA